MRRSQAESTFSHECRRARRELLYRVAIPAGSRGLQSTETSHPIFVAQRRLPKTVIKDANVATRRASRYCTPWTEVHGYRHCIATRCIRSYAYLSADSVSPPRSFLSPPISPNSSASSSRVVPAVPLGAACFLGTPLPGVNCPRRRSVFDFPAGSGCSEGSSISATCGGRRCGPARRPPRGRGRRRLQSS
jgi:hypothetical protein